MLVVSIGNVSYCDVFVFDLYHTSVGNLTDYTSLDAEEYYGNNKSIVIPVCRYYDTLTGNWSTEGCVTLWTIGNKSRCSCTHLTSFSLSEATFVPNIHIIDYTTLRNVTWENIQKYPTAFISILLILFTFWIIIICLPRANDKPIVSQMRPWSQLQYRKWKKTYDYKFDKILINSFVYKNYGICYGLFKLTWLNIKNNHYVLAVCLRDYGTNWSAPQRLFCFLASMVTLSSINAAYYGKMNLQFAPLDMTVVVNYLYSSVAGMYV